MRRQIGLVAALTVAALVATGAPASAVVRTTPTIACNKTVPPRYYQLSATADYEDNTTTGLRRWKMFRYKISGGLIDEDHNNVNIKVSKEGVVALDYRSPDDREYNKWYTLIPTTPVYTSLRGPGDVRDHREIHKVEVTAIFDRAGAEDPTCGKWVKV